jgi:hypothetical protein
MKKIFFVLLAFLPALAVGQWTTTNMTESKSSMGALTTFGSEGYWFFGGVNSDGSMSKRIERYQADTDEWCYDSLSEARAFPVGIQSGFFVIIAGGVNINNGVSSATVDIFNTQVPGGGWSTAQLSVPRFALSAEAADGLVLFAGGTDVLSGVSYDIVDILHLSTMKWTTSHLSQPRSAMGSAVGFDGLHHIAVFAGGYDLSSGAVTDRVDLYNFSTQKWSTATLSEPRGFVAATSLYGKVYIAGGMRNDNTPSDRVDIFDPETNTWSIASLCVPRAFSGENAATACGKVFFGGGGQLDLNTQTWVTSSDVMDIYDGTTGIWSVEYLDHPLINHAVVSGGNEVVFAGGTTVDSHTDWPSVYIDNCAAPARENENMPLPIRIYPNPSSGTIHIDGLENRDNDLWLLQLSDVHGALIYSVKLDPTEKSINLPNTAVGNFVIKLIHDDEVFTSRITLY